MTAASRPPDDTPRTSRNQLGTVRQTDNDDLVAPDDTPTRLQCPFCKLTGPANGLSDSQSVCAYCGRDSKDAMWEIDALRAEVSRLQQEHATVYTFLSRIIDVVAPSNPAAGGKTMTLCQQVDHCIVELRQENALLRRSLEMLTKQLDEKDERITELTFTIIRANSPA